MNKNSKRLGIYITLMLLPTVAAVSFRCAACIIDLDYKFGYFDSKTFITVARAMIFGCALICTTSAAVGHKVSLRPSFSSPATFLPTGIVGTAVIFLAVKIFKELDVIKGYENKKTVYATALLCGVLLLLSVVHFFLNALLTESKTELRAYFAIATVLGLAAYAAYLYFVGDGAINSPNRITDQMAFLTSAIFFLYEARISLGREKWRAYCVFGMIAAATCAYSSIPALILYFAKGQAISHSLEESLVVFSLFIFILARLILTVTLPEAEKNARIAALEAFASEREHAASDTERRYDETYAVQLTITDLIPDTEMPEASTDEPTEEFVFPDADEPSTVFVTEDEPDDDGQLVMITDTFITDEESEDGEDEPTDAGEDE